MNAIRRIRRSAAVLTGLAAALVVALGATPAFATIEPDQGPGYLVPASGPGPITVAGGIPGWQIALIAVGAALFAATLAVLADRTLASRRRTAVSAA